MQAEDADVKGENAVEAATSTEVIESPQLSALENLKLQRKQLEDWTKVVNARIFELETNYLEETPNGNLIKGWEVDGRQVPLHKLKPNYDEKERLFSFSSYRYLLDRKKNSEFFRQHERTHSSKANVQKQQQKKQKKRKVEYDDWNAMEDY